MKTSNVVQSFFSVYIYIYVNALFHPALENTYTSAKQNIV